ncbi:polyprenyl synthetase family protein [Nocardia yamanashiensis]|uniref:polyprenyl synthetase family protein n=1 Tax=Nocardia yamanashiensis TaxID=209247 RepID=UPI0008372646|nr:polyprenyl synthetase family protein [Nocardia yamanashiensis]
MTVTAFVPPVRRPAELLAGARAVLEPVLREAVLSLPEPLCRMAGYHFGWWDTHGRTVRADSGKGLRPALATAAAYACDGLAAAAAPAAAAVELIHNFTLVHDDVMDGDEFRRGRPTVWRVWGLADAILLGDALHALAANVLATHMPQRTAVIAVDRLERTVIELCRGQHEDCAIEIGCGTSVAEYERMAVGKTGSLFGCACALGGLCADAEPDAVDRLNRFGRELGIAFQAIDDLLGIWGDPAASGKPSSDLGRRKRSLPVVAALESGTDAGRELAVLYRGEEPLTPSEIACAARLIEECGARRWTQREAERRIRKAVAALPDRPACGDLITLAQLVAHRDK